MKKHFIGFFYSMPLQLFFLHFRRYQVMLLSWYILFATVTGNFLKPYGANSLMLAPEYLGKVNALSTSIVGFTVATFIMSWNITTFILHSRHIKFLATTAQPFLKFCINNALLPLFFLVTYLYCAIDYLKNEELFAAGNIAVLIGGFLGGFVLSLTLAFGYFFRADKNIYRKMETDITTANQKYERAARLLKNPKRGSGDLRIDWFLSATLHLRQPRNIMHYGQGFLDSIFKRHHLAAVQAVLVAFLFLVLIGYFSDNHVLQIPAAASITLLLTVFISVAAAFTLFLGNWSILVIAILYGSINWMYQQNIIDPRNKAYGLNYKAEKATYEAASIQQLVTQRSIQKDKQQFTGILNNWKKRQDSEKPVMFIVDVSGGGNRSATYVMNVLQRLDSITNGRFMEHTILINGSSGGMIGAAYYRELYFQKVQGKLSAINDKQYTANVGKDLLNPVFSSLVTRDILSPIRKFEVGNYSYIRDRGYAFEQKLDFNTKGVLNKKVMDYRLPEEQAIIPCIFFNSTITRDARKLIVSTQPISFMMTMADSSREIAPIDGIDFMRFFEKQDAKNLQLLTALRMNATFPFVLPNVELPASPDIDVMDGGIRDNYGVETSLRFIYTFKEWIRDNTSRVVLVQIRDHPFGDWDRPYESTTISGLVTKPMLLLQNNLFKFQDHYQASELGFVQHTLGEQLSTIHFSYVPAGKATVASLSFHLTASEKKGIAAALENEENKQSFDDIINLLRVQSHP